MAKTEQHFLPLTDFMQRVQTYYGQPTRLKLDRDSVVTRQTLQVAEWHLYGSSRLGIYKTQDTLRTVDLSLVYKLSDVNLAPTQTLSKKEYYSFDSTYTHKRGDKLYEGSNHFGNVLVTFTDKRLATCTEGQVHYQADVRSATDYAAFGALLDDRQWYSGLDSGVYRAGFNGMEKDDEVKGVGNSYTTYYRAYDSRLGRWFSCDPVNGSKQSPYCGNKNNPTSIKDPHSDFGLPGAVIGFVSGGVTELVTQTIAIGIENKTNGKSFFSGWGRKIDWIDVGIAGVELGLIGGLCLAGLTWAPVVKSVGGFLRSATDWRSEGKGYKIIGASQSSGHNKNILDFKRDGIANAVSLAFGGFGIKGVGIGDAISDIVTGTSKKFANRLFGSVSGPLIEGAFSGLMTSASNLIFNGYNSPKYSGQQVPTAVEIDEKARIQMPVLVHGASRELGQEGAFLNEIGAQQRVKVLKGGGVRAWYVKEGGCLKLKLIKQILKKQD